jgi:hypothetical protein
LWLKACSEVGPIYDVLFGEGWISGILKGDITNSCKVRESWRREGRGGGYHIRWIGGIIMCIVHHTPQEGEELGELTCSLLLSIFHQTIEDRYTPDTKGNYIWFSSWSSLSWC